MLLMVLIHSSCDSSTQNIKKGTPDSKVESSKVVIDTKETIRADTTFEIFNDPDYSATFKTFKPANPDEEAHFGVLTLTYKQETILLNDTLEFFQPILQLKDFNNDGIKDILILYSSSARSNWTHSTLR